MSTFKAATAAPVVDPAKHVNYTYGMVLGVDDFTQEFAYHSNRDRWAARDVEGYGTLAGLRVTVEENGAGELEVVVTAGTALNPRGELIRVPVAQCAEINRWLAVAKNRAAVVDLLGQPPIEPLRLFVVLCYRDCPVDSLPVPGEPCRSEEESLAPSRLQDGFLLELRLEPPRQTEEDAVRDFVRWLVEHTEFTDEPGAFTELEDFLAHLRAAVVEVSSPPDDSPPSSPPSDFMLDDSPPFVMRVECSRRGEYLRAAFRVWATELRPRWRPAHFDEPCCCADAKHGTDRKADDDLDCLLLAELSVPLTASFRVDKAVGVTVNQERRPYLLHQRVLQEWLLDGGCCACATQTGSPPELLIGGGGATGPAGGDLSGTYPNPTVARLQTRPVSATAPSAAGQVLTWSGTQWGPAAPPDARLVLPFVTITDTTQSGGPFLLWFNLDALGNRVEVLELTPEAVSVFIETEDAANNFLQQLDMLRDIPRGGRNLFTCRTERVVGVLRFRFDLRAIRVTVGRGRMTLLRYVRDNNLNFSGYDGDSTVTAFVVSAGGLIGE